MISRPLLNETQSRLFDLYNILECIEVKSQIALQELDTILPFDGSRLFEGRQLLIDQLSDAELTKRIVQQISVQIDVFEELKQCIEHTVDISDSIGDIIHLAEVRD